MQEIDYESRKAIARYVLSRGQDELAFLATELLAGKEGTVDAADAASPLLTSTDLGIAFPAGLAPSPQPRSSPPGPSDALPVADAVVITWTIDEVNALADVLTPGYRVGKWYFYNRHFDDHYASLIRPGAPSLYNRMLGSWFLTQIGHLSVLCLKSSLHLNQDGIRTGPGIATLPVKDLFAQIVDEVQPQVVLTVGTAGSVFADFQLGDVVVSRAAKFRLASEFANEPFNHQVYRSDWRIPTTQLDQSRELMQPFASNLTEPPFGPPTVHYRYHDLIHTDPNVPDIKLEQDGRDMPEFHPILTTDYFEYGTSENHLDAEGCAVEMGDAALGLAMSEITSPPKWAAIRNMSDPQINGKLPTSPYRLNQQTMWAVGYYTGYGYTTSVCSALATWGVLAGL